MSSRDPFDLALRGGPPGAPPDDVELMMWVDGELDLPRSAEVEAFVARDARARAIVAALRRGSEAVAAGALERAESSGADSLADRVMAALDAPSPVAPFAPAAPPRRKRGPIWQATAMTIGVGFAAAAGWMVMARSPALRQVGAALVDDPAGGLMAQRLVGGPLAEGAMAAIDVVDFGSRPGAILYMPAEGGGTVAVVWVTEDDGSPSNGESL